MANNNGKILGGDRQRKTLGASTPTARFDRPEENSGKKANLISTAIILH